MKKILVIDDEQRMRRKILEILTYEGFEAIGAANGHTGVQLAQEHLPDLILCDITMPKLSGYGVLFRLRNDPLTAAIPFIFLTAKAAMSDLREGMRLGADDYLTKPFQIDELLSAINTRLEKHTVVSKQLEDLRLNLSLCLPHELRTPLNPILGFSELLMHLGPERLPDPEEIIEIQAAIHTSALHLQRLIENYLLYADLKLMEYEPERRRRKIWRSDDVIHTKHVISSFARHKAEEAQRQEDLILAPVEADIRISKNSLQKIVMELLDNAFKFSEPGAPVQLVTNISGNQFTISITDQGRGMTKEQIANIGAYMQFERKRYEQQGSGLGLIISHLLAKLNDGELIIESEVNQGTTVTVVFNRNDKKDAETQG